MFYHYRWLQYEHLLALKYAAIIRQRNMMHLKMPSIILRDVEQKENNKNTRSTARVYAKEAERQV